MLFGVDLPDPFRSVSVTRRTIQHAGPEHESLHFLSIGVQTPFVADLADQDRHRRRLHAIFRHLVCRRGDALPVVVAGLEHIKVKHRRILNRITSAPRGMNGDEAVVRVYASNVLGHVGPSMFLNGCVLSLIFREVIGHRTLTRQTPDDREGSPTSNEVPPMLFDLRESHER